MARRHRSEIGFSDRSAPVGSLRLTRIVAASLAIGALSLFAVVALTIVATRTALAVKIGV
ncbi:MAG TPA: hypothetical protein VNZ94_13840 [Xanthobacteraceae bacterium]|nr:hypothetical protein [Xanthobacteraceae bacterium]